MGGKKKTFEKENRTFRNKTGIKNKNAFKVKQGCVGGSVN